MQNIENMETVKLGYARTSTKKQKLESQISKIESMGVLEKDIYKDKFSGKKEINLRQGWNDLEKKINELLENGKKVEVHLYSINRMSRDEEEGYKKYMELNDKGVKLFFDLEPHLNTEKFNKELESAKIGANVGAVKDNDLMSELIESIMAGIERFLRGQAKENIRLAFRQAEKEGNDIVEKVKLGLKNSTKVRINYSRIKKTKIPKSFKKDIEKNSIKGLMSIYDKSRQTVYNWKKLIEENDQDKYELI